MTLGLPKRKRKETHLESNDEIKDATTPAGYIRKQVYRRRKHDAQDAQEVGQGDGGDSDGEREDAAEEGEDTEKRAEGFEDGGEVHFEDDGGMR